MIAFALRADGQDNDESHGHLPQNINLQVIDKNSEQLGELCKNKRG